MLSWFNALNKPDSDRASTSAASLMHRNSTASSNGIINQEPKTAININVYDLLPPGKISSVFWTFGVSLLHTGVAIHSREYAFGGHDRRGLTGVYYMAPKQEPPGGTFRTSFIHGYTTLTASEIDAVLKSVGEEFQGTSYNVLTRNCNHFTSYLCERLTGKAAPAWINRAASIGVALPCVVPSAWVAPPECEEEVQLRPEDLDSGGEGDSGEERRRRERRRSRSDDEWTDDYDDDEDLFSLDGERREEEEGRSGKKRDEAGMVLPESERADMGHRIE